MPETAWPANVASRYLTKAAEITSDFDLTVDVLREPDGAWRYLCRGCGADWCTDYDPSVHSKAQAHAATCRALRRPTS